MTVSLRPFAREDLAELEHWLQPDQDWHRWDAPYFPKASSAAVSEHISRMAASIAAGSASDREFAVVDGGVLVGRVAWHWEHETSRWARCGITVYDPAHRARGIGEAALRLLTDVVFTGSDAHRLDFITWSGNAAMCRVGEKLGWTLEARFRQAREVRGIRYDSVVYGVLRNEWAARPHDP